MATSDAKRIVAMCRRWIRDGYTDNETPIDDYGAEILREVIAAASARGGGGDGDAK